MLLRVERLEVARPAVQDGLPSVGAHGSEQDAVIVGHGRDLVGRHHLGIDVVHAGDVAASAAGLDELVADVHDGRDHVEVEEREGGVGGIIRLLLGIAGIDLLGGLLRKEETGVLVGDVGCRSGLDGHDYALSASLAWTPLA